MCTFRIAPLWLQCLGESWFCTSKLDGFDWGPFKCLTQIPHPRPLNTTYPRPPVYMYLLRSSHDARGSNLPDPLQQQEISRPQDPSQQTTAFCIAPPEWCPS